MHDYLTPANLFSPDLTSIGRLPMGAPLNAVAGRSTHSLDGKWDFLLVDSPPDAPSGWTDVGHDLSENPWRQIRVPGVWTRQGVDDLPQYTNVVMPWAGNPPDVPERNPTGLYRTAFARPDAKRVIVEFGGFESVLVVWCNA